MRRLLARVDPADCALVLALVLGVTFAVLSYPARAYDPNEALYRVTCPGGWGVHDIRTEAARSATGDDDRAHAMRLAHRTLDVMRSAWGRSYEFQMQGLVLGSGGGFIVIFDFRTNTTGDGTVTCTVAQLEAPRASLWSMTTEQGVTLAVAVGLAWSLAWGFRQIVRAINDTDGETS